MIVVIILIGAAVATLAGCVGVWPECEREITIRTKCEAPR